MSPLLYLVQRGTAAILAVTVAVHLGTILYAVRGGLTAAEVLARTHGSVLWAGFYALFVFAASVHGAIGLRTVAAEWLRWRGRSADGAAALIALGIAAVGMRAIAAVAL